MSSGVSSTSCNEGGLEAWERGQLAITPLGSALAAVPLEPTLARMLIAGQVSTCAELTVALVAGISSQNPFVFSELGSSRAQDKDDASGNNTDSINDAYGQGAGDDDKSSVAEGERPGVGASKGSVTRGLRDSIWQDENSDALAVLRAVGAYSSLLIVSTRQRGGRRAAVLR